MDPHPVHKLALCRHLEQNLYHIKQNLKQKSIFCHKNYTFSVKIFFKCEASFGHLYFMPVKDFSGYLHK